jgi:hypothetical protein
VSKKGCKVCGATEDLQYDTLYCRTHYLEYRKRKREEYKAV